MNALLFRHTKKNEYIFHSIYFLSYCQEKTVLYTTLFGLSLRGKKKKKKEGTVLSICLKRDDVTDPRREEWERERQNCWLLRFEGIVSDLRYCRICDIWKMCALVVFTFHTFLLWKLVQPNKIIFILTLEQILMFPPPPSLPSFHIP